MKRYKLKKKYIIIVILLILLAFVLPLFKPVFESMGELSLPVRLFLTFSDIVRKYFIIIVGFIFVLNIIKKN